MKVDAANSRYQEDPTAEAEFTEGELKSLRFLMRRLRFLETQVARAASESGDPSGGLVFAEREIEALAYTLYAIGYLADTE